MSKQIRSFILLLFVAGSGVLVGGTLAAQALSDGQDYYQALELFSQVLHRIRQDYVEEVSADDMIEGAIEGMVQRLDPYSQYMTPEQYRQFQEETSGDYYGIGVEITHEADGLRVVTPYPGSPAEKAGLEPEDLIVSVDGTPIIEIGPAEAVNRIKGRKGTKVIIGVERKGWEYAKDITVVRDQIHTPAVVAHLLEGNFGYIQVVQFQERVASEVQEAAEELEKDSKGELKGLLLDLRNNPGGLLEEAVRLADLFIERGVIVKTEGRREDPEIEYARRGGELESIPMVLLINRGSASASEILAGALQDHNRAILVGERSYGKGLVQNIIRLENDGALRLTVAKYYTPSGRPIEPNNSIVPDVLVAQENDPYAEMAQSGDDESGQERDEAAPDPEHDNQLREALEQLKHPTVNLGSVPPAEEPN